MRPYRVLFALAAAYNVAFGVWAGFFPQAFFTLFRLEPINYPSLWACLGMVVGVYALAYAYVAWKPEDGDVLIWIGLIGKILGPIGWVKTVSEGGLPPRTFPLILFNDLIWWFPFLLYLFRNHKRRGEILVAIIAAVHVAACLGLVVVREGLDFKPDLAARRLWVLGHIPLWIPVWFFWALCSLSLTAFFPLWGLCLQKRFGVKGAVCLAALIVLAVPFDVIGEWHYLVRATDPRSAPEAFAKAVAAYNFYSAAVANGLYCVLGLIFSALSWRAAFLKGGVGVLGFLTWAAGFLLTASALLSWRAGTVAGGFGVMVLFLPWLVLMGRRLDGPGKTA
ncbi:MAG TPA: hypothetical protein VFX30_06840 [bacterium]|nr:hypothetical protein [bacterium]